MPDDATLTRACEFSVATPKALGGRRAYRQFCAVAGLDAVDGGYGLLHCEDPHDGTRTTLVTRDVEYVEMLAAAPAEARAGITVPPGKFLLSRTGWPDEW